MILSNHTDDDPNAKVYTWNNRMSFTWNNIGILFEEGDHYAMMQSLPMVAMTENVTLSQLPIYSLTMKWKQGTPTSTINNFQKDFLESTNSGSKVDFYTGGLGDTTTTTKISNILEYVFDTIIVLTMFLCFFALSANMSANLYEQTKEIGVMRSIGFTKHRIRWLYFYEAVILVLASCTMGVMVGMVVAYSFVT